MAGKSNKRRSARHSKRRRKRRGRIILILEILVLLVLCGVLYVVTKLDRLGTNDLTGIEMNDVDSEELEGYTNIALFGLDSRDGSLEKGARTDAMMIASINNQTKEIKLVSVYRDTYLRQDDDVYTKANAAYATGGAESAINMLNKNLDMNIEQYVAIDFSALVITVDHLGGLEIEIDEAERQQLNHIIKETSSVTGVATTEVPDTGLVLLDGVQSTAYARIRYTEGDDYRRTERQREVISKILDKAKGTNLSTLDRIIDDVLPHVSTNLTTAEMLKMASNILSYELGETTGFPFDTTSMNISGSGSCVIPEGLAQNVEQLHEFLFEDEEYEVSAEVAEISEEIVWKTGVYPAVKEESEAESDDSELSDDEI